MSEHSSRSLYLFAQLVDLDEDQRRLRLENESPEVRERLCQMFAADRAELTLTLQDAVSEQLELPARVGPFELGEQVSQGGMGWVFRGEQAVPRRKLALKLLRPELFTESARLGFRSEIDALARFSGRGVPWLIAAGTEGGWPWLAMEWIDGPHLDTWAEGKPISVLFDTLIEVCHTVDRAHREGVAHLDLKPANIRVSDRGPVVLDLGLARIVGAPMEAAGTPGWRAPEQARRTRADARSDVFALGRLFEELLGRTSLIPTAVLARVTAPEPARRPATAGALAALLLEQVGAPA